PFVSADNSALSRSPICTVWSTFSSRLQKARRSSRVSSAVTVAPPCRSAPRRRPARAGPAVRPRVARHARRLREIRPSRPDRASRLRPCGRIARADSDTP
ncbi:Gfa-like protein, partial [Candidatus Burkholderia humilis]